MLSILKDMPDWMVGTMMAGGAWFGICHSVLAERAMGDDIDQRVTPSCVATLRAEEAKAIDARVERLTKNAMRDLERQRDGLVSEDNRLLEQEQEIRAVNQSIELMNKSPLGQLMHFPDMGLNPEMIARRRASIQRQITALKLPTFDIPPVPDAAVLKTCACATADAMGSKQSAYAISLATFRIWNPEEIKTFGADVTKSLSTDVCGPKPWETAP